MKRTNPSSKQQPNVNPRRVCGTHETRSTHRTILLTHLRPRRHNRIEPLENTTRRPTPRRRISSGVGPLNVTTLTCHVCTRPLRYCAFPHLGKNDGNKIHNMAPAYNNRGITPCSVGPRDDDVRVICREQYDGAARSAKTRVFAVRDNIVILLSCPGDDAVSGRGEGGRKGGLRFTTFTNARPYVWASFGGRTGSRIFHTCALTALPCARRARVLVSALSTPTTGKVDGRPRRFGRSERFFQTRLHSIAVLIFSLTPVSARPVLEQPLN